MLNQKETLCEENNPIVDLVRFENSIKQIDVDRPVNVRLAKDGSGIKLTYGGVEICGAVDRPLKHQLGSRMWMNKTDYSEIEEIWQDRVSTNLSGLENELASAFRKNDLSIRYFTDSKGKNKIYGIVTPHFVDVNQLDFRQNFLDATLNHIAVTPKSCGFERSKYGKVTEFFEFDAAGFQTKYRYGLVYAKNNGYDAYRVDWGREVVVCKNGLTIWKGSKYRWKHTKEINLNHFIENTVKEGLENQQLIEDRINASKERSLQQCKLKELLARISLAQASKMRIRNRLDDELNDVGVNEWALSQVLTWLGTHEKYVPPSTKPKLIHLGTCILEKSLTSVLNTKTHIGQDGYYGFILPTDLPRVRQQLNSN
ncbi:MAG: hypothetical protein K9L30_18530 [Desulfobacterales bacterium]|nr:hypothetical protein [Desulfobacterales bacterium]